MTMRRAEMAAALHAVQADAAGADDGGGRAGAQPAVLVTAPKPVMTPQASSDAASSGTVGGMTTTWTHRRRRLRQTPRCADLASALARSGRCSGLWESRAKLVSQVTVAPCAQDRNGRRSG